MFNQYLYFAITSCVVLNEVLGYAQHPGAYSSPQYAKKSVHYTKPYNQPSRYPEMEYQKISQSHLKQDSERSKHQDLDIQESANVQVESENVNQDYQNIDRNDIGEANVTEVQSGRSAGFMETAGNFLNGRGGQMLADIAREVISRSTGASSQVLSLNLTNLVILVILKALILAAGMFGAGAWTGGYGRSLEGSSNSQWVSGAELDLWSSYLKGAPGCLGRAACRSPDLAKRYCGGADIALTTAKLFNGYVPYDIKYEKIVEEAKEAAAYGAAGMNCEERYKC